MVSHMFLQLILHWQIASSTDLGKLMKIGHSLLRSLHAFHTEVSLDPPCPSGKRMTWRLNFCKYSQTHRYHTDIHRLFTDCIRFYGFTGWTLLRSNLEKSTQTQQFVPREAHAEKSAHIFCVPRTLCSTSGAKM